MRKDKWKEDGLNKCERELNKDRKRQRLFSKKTFLKFGKVHYKTILVNFKQEQLRAASRTVPAGCLAQFSIFLLLLIAPH